MATKWSGQYGWVNLGKRGGGILVNTVSGNFAFARPSLKLKERLLLKFLRARVILGLLDTLVDIGVLAEKEVIQ
jgi:hypothetical protein